MIPYFFIFFLLFLPLKKQHINNWCFLLLLIFTIIRWDVGYDYRIYYSLANSFELKKLPLFINNEEIIKYLTSKLSFVYLKTEITLRVICQIIWQLNLQPEFIFLFYGIVILTFLKKGLENLNIYNKFVWLWFYSFPYFYFFSLSLLRQWAAISIVFYSYKYIKEKNFLKYLCFIVIAALFHKTALLMILLYILKIMNINKKIHIFLFCLSFFFDKIFSFIVLNVNLPLVSNYKIYVLKKVGLGGGKLYYIILSIYVILLFRILLFKIKNIELKRIYDVTMLGCFIYISLIKLGHLGIRISIYFFVFSLVLINEYTKTKISKVIVFILSLLFLSNLLILDNLRQDVRSEYVPYQVIFNKKFIKGD